MRALRVLPIMVTSRLLQANTTSQWPSQWGLRCGLALASLEIGIAITSVFPSLSTLPQRVLFFLGPLFVYALFGLLLDFGIAKLPVPRKGSRLLPILVVLVFAYRSVSKTWILLQTPLQFGLAALSLFFAIFLLKRGWPSRPHIQLRIQRVAIGVCLIGFLFLVAFLATDRSIEQRTPHGQLLDSPNVVVITLDTLRADVLPLYGGKGLETPHLDQLASQSIVFDDMCAVSPITGPSHASILTGVMPPTHALRSNGPFSLDPGVVTLAETLSRAGYATGAVISAYPVRGEIGFNRGFDVFDDRLPQDNYQRLMALGPASFQWLRPLVFLRKLTGRPVISGDLLLDRTQDFLNRKKGSFFLWAHFFDAHDPHVAHGQWKKRAHQLADSAWPTAVGNDFSKESLLQYRGQVMEVDNQVGRLLAQIKVEDPDLSNTVIFLLSDHGQCFGEGGFEVTHKPSLQEATQHIPGMLYTPAVKTARRTSFPVNQIDVMPTLCALTGLAIPENVQGVDLTPIAHNKVQTVPRALFHDGFYMEAYQASLRGKDIQARIRIARAAQTNKDSDHIFLEKNQEWLGDSDMRKQAVRGQDWKYIRVFNGESFLYDLSIVNPEGHRETHNLVTERPEIRQKQIQKLDRLIESMPTGLMNTNDMTPIEQQLLDELGY